MTTAPVDLLDAARAWVDELLLTHPEIRGVAVTFDFHGTLNDQEIGSLWRTRTDNRTPDETTGMAMQILKIQHFLFGVHVAITEKCKAMCEEGHAALRDVTQQRIDLARSSEAAS